MDAAEENNCSARMRLHISLFFGIIVTFAGKKKSFRLFSLGFHWSQDPSNTC